MAKYKKYCYKQALLLPVVFENQIQPGTFEYTLNYLIDNHIDLSIFDGRYNNDETGAPAYDPAILLKIILFAYSRGIVSSRKIEQACRENIVFMALSADTQPHFTTIADFISSMDEEIVHLFLEVLLICDEMNLIGKNMFAIDGCKMPSNASKEWSGTMADLARKKEKMEKAVRHILNKHRTADHTEVDADVRDQEDKYIKVLNGHIEKISAFIEQSTDRIGKSGKPVKSNITDKDSAKMKTSHGTIQGYDGVASVDDKHQIVVHAEAFGQAQEHDLLQPMIERTCDNLDAIGACPDVFKKAKVTADAGFHNEKNMEYLAEENIDGYVADTGFRKRDPRFNDIDKYKERHRKEQSKKRITKTFTVDDFKVADDLSHSICPAGCRMYSNGRGLNHNGRVYMRYKGPKSGCVSCHLRSDCLRYPDRTECRTIDYLIGRAEAKKETFTARMKRKIDSESGRAAYSKRIGTVEPVFGNIRHILGLDRFTLRGRIKVNIQWQLYCIVHNLLKVHRFGTIPDTG